MKMDIIEADELIAVWRYKQCNRFTRSVNFSGVPQEWRYSAPPHNCDDFAERELVWRAYGFDIKNPLGSIPSLR